MANTETPALIRMREWLSADKSRTKAALARKLGVSPPSVHAWFEGQTRPEPHLRVALHDLTGISPEEWWTEAERASLDATRKRIADAEAEEPARESLTGT